MRRFLKNHGLTAAGVAFAVMIISAALWNSHVRSSRREQEQTRNHLADLMYAEIAGINETLDEVRLRGENLAFAAGQSGDVASLDTERLFDGVAERSEIADVFLTLPDGSLLFADGAGLEIGPRIGADPGSADGTAVSGVFTLADGRRVFGVTAPILRGGTFLGSVTSLYETALFASGAFAGHFYGGQGSTLIFQSDGLLLLPDPGAGFDGESFFSAMERAELGSGALESLRSDIAASESGFLSYTLEGEEYFCHYAPTGQNGWYAAVSVPISVIESQSSASSRGQILFSLEVAAAIFILLAFLTADSRARHRDLIRANDLLNLSQERFGVALSHMPYLVFEYDFEREIISILTNPDDGALFAGQSPLTRERLAELIHPDDSEVLLRLFRDAKTGVREGGLHIRIRSGGEGEENEYRWYSLVLSSIFDSGHRPVRAVGTLEDINDQRAETLRLRERADTDPLTGVYNRAATERMINSIIADGRADDKYSFMVVDLDDFKNINDTLGHLYGDEVLKDVARALSSAFRNTDVIGRLGGDEFSVFLKGIANIEIIRRKLKKPLALLARTEKHRPMGVSLSVGVAFGSSGNGFTDLYRRADIALYKAKHDGKNRIEDYSDDLEPNRTEKTAIARTAERGAQPEA